jgi:hypothetical protein
MVDIPFPLGSQTVPSHSYKLLTSHSYLNNRPKSKSKWCYDRRSVGQSVLISTPIWGPRPDIYTTVTTSFSATLGALCVGRVRLAHSIQLSNTQSCCWVSSLYVTPWFQTAIVTAHGVDSSTLGVWATPVLVPLFSQDLHLARVSTCASWGFELALSSFSLLSLHYLCLVTASNGRCSPSSGFPNCPRPWLPTSYFLQLQLSTKQWLTAKLLLALASTVFFGSESHWAYDQIWLSDGCGSLQTFF